MDRDDRIDEVVDRWENLRAVGEDISPEELCRDYPDLLDDVQRQVAALQWVPEAGPAADGLVSFTSHDAEGQPVANPPVPQTLGRYRLEEPIGAGGFGQVWKGFDPELKRHVAIKIPRPDRASSPAADERFLEEAQKVAQLRHPGIVPVHDVGHQDAYCYIVSDLIDGENLAERIKQEPVPWTEAVRIVTAVAESLHFAHEHDFIHRDVKPANILLDGDSHVFLADFGIAATEQQLQEESGTSGTLAYMSPEQARGNTRDLDRRTDLFSLGVVLYELLTGQRPFTGKRHHELREQILTAAPTPPRRTKPTIPPTLEQVCLRALAKDPAERFQTAAAMAEALRTVGRAGTERSKLVMVGAMLAAVTVLASIMWSIGALRMVQGPNDGGERAADEKPATHTESQPTAAENGSPPVLPAAGPGSPEWNALERDLAKKAEQAVLPRLNDINQSLKRFGQMPSIRKPPAASHPESKVSAGVPVPVAWFKFDDAQDRLRNSGCLGATSGLKIRGKVTFTEPDDADAPPRLLGSGVRLNNGVTQEGLIGDKSLLRGPAWSISLWFWQQAAHDKDFLVYVGALDGYGGGSAEFSAAVVNPGIFEVVCFPELTPESQQTIVGQLPVTPRTWHQVTLTFAAKDTAITSVGTTVAYLDGKEVGRRDDIFLAPAVRFAKADLVFGAVARKYAPDTWLRALDGVLADIRIYDAVLDAEQVFRMYAAFGKD